MKPEVVTATCTEHWRNIALAQSYARLHQTRCKFSNLRYRGTVFKLTPSNGSWTYTWLHDFTNGSDGGAPWGSVIFDASGDLYGTAQGGSLGGGVIWEITP